MKLTGTIRQINRLSGTIFRAKTETQGGGYETVEIVPEVVETETGSPDELIVNRDTVPIAFYTSGNTLDDCVIYGASGGVGDLNSTTGKYDIPITVQGKNVIVNTLASQTYNGITLTRNSDGSVTLNGTAEASMNFSMTRDTHTLNPDDYQPIENAVYVISGSPEGAAVNKYMMSFRYVSAIGSTSSFARIPQEGLTIDNTGGEYNYIAPYISVWSGITCNNVTFRPMLRLAGTSDTYEALTAKTTRTISIDAPLTAGQSISAEQAGITLPTSSDNWNTLTVDTSVKPEVMITYRE